MNVSLKTANANSEMKSAAEGATVRHSAPEQKTNGKKRSNNERQPAYTISSSLICRTHKKSNTHHLN